MTPARDQQRTRILIVDDNPAIHRDFRKILESDSEGHKAALRGTAAEIFGEPEEATEQHHFEIDSAHQGQEALKMVRNAREEEHPYALAFVDMRMPPGWDGIETIARV